MLNPMEKMLSDHGTPLRSTQQDSSRGDTEQTSKDLRPLPERSASTHSECRSSLQSEGEDSLGKPQIEIIVDGIRCTPVVGKVLLQSKQISTLLHETLGCDLVFLEEVGREFLGSISQEVVCDLMHIAVNILHIQTFNLMSNDLSNASPSWQPKVALRLEDLVKHIDILKFLVNQKKEKQKMHMQSLNNNNIPGNFAGSAPGGVLGSIKRAARDAAARDAVRDSARDGSEDEYKCKIPRISPSPASGVGYSPGLHGMPLGHPPGLAGAPLLGGRSFIHPTGHPTSPSDIPPWAQGFEKNNKMIQDVNTGNTIPNL